MIDVKIHVRDHGVKELLTRLAEKSRNTRPAMAEIGEIVVESVQRNFEERRSPSGIRWRALSPRYRKWKQKKTGRSTADLILNRILMAGIHRSHATNSSVTVSTARLAYAAIHQFGGKTGKGGIMPARPYMGVRREDWTEIKKAITRHLGL